MTGVYLFGAAIAVATLICVPLVGVGILGLAGVFGVVVPYVSFALLLAGIVYRVAWWTRSPVPFHIPTVCGQQKSLAWIRNNPHESPSSAWEVAKRMALEVFFFRSLLRNDRVRLRSEGRLVFGAHRFLWLGGLLFHWSLLIVVVRHFRFFFEPVPFVVTTLEAFDAMFEIAIPTILLTDLAVLISVSYLFLRRVFSPQVRYISLTADYFPLLLILSIVVTGVLMRHFFKTDLYEVKRMAMGIIGFHPAVPGGVGILFYVHLFLVCVLFAYLPVSKLSHMAGIFLSPTRNLMNNSRAKRHINPWSYPVKIHTYGEYEEEFEEAMKEAGLPLEKEGESARKG